MGAGAAPADVLLVASAPGAAEDALGQPLAGAGADLLGAALGDTGIAATDVCVTALVKCLPPGGRDPSPSEVVNCSEHLAAEVELVRPVVVVALGGFATNLLRGDRAPIRERRGREEPRRLGSVTFWLLPTFHPAAALYAPALVEQLRADLARLPEVMARGRPDAEVAPLPEPEAVAGPGQLELFGNGPS